MNWNLVTFSHFWQLTIVIQILLAIVFQSIADAKDITVWHSKTNFLTAKPKETFFVVEDFTRAGDKAQLFVLEHGQCSGQDCKWSAQRSERRLNIIDRSKSKIGNPIYYSMSIFIPEKFDPIPVKEPLKGPSIDKEDPQIHWCPQSMQTLFDSICKSHGKSTGLRSHQK